MPVQQTLRIINVSGTFEEEKSYPDKFSMLSSYNEFLHSLQRDRFEERTDDVFVFQSPQTNMIAYKDVFGNIALVTPELFYRRHYANKPLVQKVKSITGDE